MDARSPVSYLGNVTWTIDTASLLFSRLVIMHNILIELRHTRTHKQNLLQIAGSI